MNAIDKAVDEWVKKGCDGKGQCEYCPDCEYLLKRELNKVAIPKVCTNCNKPSDNLILECPDCYATGWAKEGFISKDVLRENLDELIFLIEKDQVSWGDIQEILEDMKKDLLGSEEKKQ